MDGLPPEVFVVLEAAPGFPEAMVYEGGVNVSLAWGPWFEVSFYERPLGQYGKRKERS